MIFRNVYGVISKFVLPLEFGEKTMKSLWYDYVYGYVYGYVHDFHNTSIITSLIKIINAFWPTLWIAVIVGSNPTRFLPKALVLLWVLHLSLHSITCIWSRLNFDKSWVSVAINEGNCHDKRKEGADSLIWVRFKDFARIALFVSSIL